MRGLCLAACLVAGPALAAGHDSADVLFLGEVHDNPAHHARQAEIVAEVQPAAIVWEMLTPAQAGQVAPDLVPDEDALGAALGWAESGWPDFFMYYPIFAAAPEAAHYGALVTRQAAGEVMQAGLAATFGAQASAFGLDSPLPEDELQTRLDGQQAAHCNAMPEEMLPVMVEIQRLRDGTLAAAALQAFEETGGPVAVITGNGHARKDWGAPALLARAAPKIRIFALGQGETGRGAPEGGFDVIESAPPVERGDPCAAFN
ncbi:ChaN family lipoprotein [Pseudoponticoccus marisrubri]|uniref:Haem-binding uptake Tiki superfamily ChaN domain-containing protein n=1 Tax=Pseudoponticoccus marisrubri TaxID=1685382 RepID=A0A0W7WPS5_9RHOB|nr:ChaN family lipoprotein [Pseudoponticoccus marisrubri]KUF12591.1 hypothetical protein AVJ23_02370 [Pseudoponticoccus marisrubri]